MNRGILYGVGVGPGDPELLTLKARRVLTEADVIAVPDKGAGEKTALNIIGGLAEGKELLYCAAPMVRDEARLEAAYAENAGKIAERLDAGKNVAFITLGDPSVYSTYLYIHRRVAAMGYDARIVPGVPSFCAAAAALGCGLCEGGERLLVVPASYRNAEDCLDVDANFVFMKAGRDLDKLRDALERRGLLGRAALVENCGMASERVCPRFEDADGGYFSLVIVKKEK